MFFGLCSLFLAKLLRLTEKKTALKGKRLVVQASSPCPTFACKVTTNSKRILPPTATSVGVKKILLTMIKC